MSKEKKKIELKDEELEKVSGGFKTLTIYSFDDGDCFENNYYKFKEKAIIKMYRKMKK